MEKRLIIFDIDGTLLYSEKIDSQCFADTYLKIYNKTFPTIDWSRFPHVTDDTIFRTVIKNHFDRPAEKEEIDHFQDEFVALLKTKRQVRPDDFREVPNARSMVEHLLSKDSFEVGIATGGWRKPALLKLSHVGIPTKDLRMSFADNNPTREDIIGGVLNHDKIQEQKFNKVVYVGDAPWDVKTTRNLNMNFIGIRRRGDHEKLKQMGAETILTDYSDQAQFLKAIDLAQPPKKL